MKLEGIHHITAITGDAPRNVDFYTRVMGLRLVKKSVNQDDPTVYHLFYADEEGDPGSDLTFFEYPGLPQGQAGEGMVHRVVWRVASSDAQDFWAERLADNDTESTRDGDALVFFDPEGLEHELVVVDVPDPPLIAEHPEVPAEHALQGFHAVRAYNSQPEVNDRLFEEAWASSASTTAGSRAVRSGAAPTGPRPPPLTRPRQGAGSVHHVAWSAGMDEQEELARARGGGRRSPHAGDRPLLLPVGLLPHAGRRAVRDRHPRSGLRGGRGRRTSWARRWPCRRSSRTGAPRSSRGSRRCRTHAP